MSGLWRSPRPNTTAARPAPAGAWLGPPPGDCLRRELHGQAAAGAQTGIVLGPVGHPVPLLGDVMAPSGIRFEWQEGCPCMVEGTRPDLTLPEAAPAGDHCNKATS